MLFEQRLIDYAMRKNALTFGEFILKSERVSPYFFNAASLYNGEELTVLGLGYAEKIMSIITDREYAPDSIVLFGPAYKGIFLGTVAATALWKVYGLSVPVVTARKEVKDHGEGGIIVGDSLQEKNVIIIDDVITAGTAVRDSQKVIAEAGGTFAGLVVIFDREERGQDSPFSARQEIQKWYSVPVESILTFRMIREYLQEQFDRECEYKTRVKMWIKLEHMAEYYKGYGVD